MKGIYADGELLYWADSEDPEEIGVERYVRDGEINGRVLRRTVPRDAIVIGEQLDVGKNTDIFEVLESSNRQFVKVDRDMIHIYAEGTKHDIRPGPTLQNLWDRYTNSMYREEIDRTVLSYIKFRDDLFNGTIDGVRASDIVGDLNALADQIREKITVTSAKTYLCSILCGYESFKHLMPKEFINCVEPDAMASMAANYGRKRSRR